jgi:xanthosine utilization system XapX-like protein
MSIQTPARGLVAGLVGLVGLVVGQEKKRAPVGALVGLARS